MDDFSYLAFKTGDADADNAAGTSDDKDLITMNDFSGHPSPEWSQDMGGALPPPFQTSASDRGHLLTGIGLGVAAAVVGAALWAVLVVVTGYQLGIGAIAIALLIAKAIHLGSRGLSSTVLRLSSVGLTLLAMAVSEYLIIRHFVNESLAAEGVIERIPLLISPVDTVLIVGESVAMDPLTLVFWAIALYSAWRYSASPDPAAPAPEIAAS